MRVEHNVRIYVSLVVRMGIVKYEFAKVIVELILLGNPLFGDGL